MRTQQAEVIEAEPTTALALVERLTPMELFTKGKLRSIVDQIRAEVRAVDTDISTEAGRKAIASLAYKVSRSKTFIDEQRKKLVADEKKRLAAIDEEGRTVREELDAPLTDWENAEKGRIEEHERRIREMSITASATYVTLQGVELAKARLDEWYDHNFQEFSKRALAAREKAALNLQAEEKRLKQEEADRLERNRLAAEAAEKARIEREAKIAEDARLKAEAEARRRADAEAAAAKQREDDLIRQAAEEKARLEREKKESEERLQKAIDEARAKAQREKLGAHERERKAEADRIAAEKKAEADRIAAEKKAEQDREAAIAAERKRQDDERKAEEAKRDALTRERVAREANQAHRAKVHRSILADLEKALYGEDPVPDELNSVLIKAIVAIANGRIGHITIDY